MRISDWSSDVCSFDLLINEADEIELEQRKSASNDTTKISKVRLRVDKALVAVRDEIGVESEAVDELTKSVRNLGEQSSQLDTRMDKVIIEEFGRASGRARVCPYV